MRVQHNQPGDGVAVKNAIEHVNSCDAGRHEHKAPLRVLAISLVAGNVASKLDDATMVQMATDARSLQFGASERDDKRARIELFLSHPQKHSLARQSIGKERNAVFSCKLRVHAVFKETVMSIIQWIAFAFLPGGPIATCSSAVRHSNP